jgi:tetratricopeptide (TPR) repeat protein
MIETNGRAKMQRTGAVCTLATVLAAGCADLPDHTSNLDLYEQRMAFTGGINRSDWPSFSLLRDSANQKIAKRCIEGASHRDLAALDVPNLEDRLAALLEGNVLISQGDMYTTGFPVITGDRRERLDSIAVSAAGTLEPLADSMIGVLREAFQEEHLLFHLLWSRVIDEIWFESWQHLYPDQPGPPDVVWIVHPAHPYAVGTNYLGLPGGGNLALTWSEQFTDHLSALSEIRFDLYQSAWNLSVADTAARRSLETFGFVDDEDTFTGFAYRDGDDFDDLVERLRDRYAEAVAAACDVDSAGEVLGLDIGETYVVLLHEVAYALFEQLSGSGSLTVPPALLEGGSTRLAKNLASLVLDRPPGIEDEALALFMKAGWHGTPEGVEKFKEVLVDKPDDPNILLYLGMSLYDLESYDEAIQTFQRLSLVTARDSTRADMPDWCSIWIGHIHDVTGNREQALRFYRPVAESGDSLQMRQFGQYNIGPTTAKAWAGERITAPWERR